MIKMVLSPAEILCAKFLGITRQMMKFGTRTSNARVSKKDDVQINYEGALGEVARRRHLSLRPAHGGARSRPSRQRHQG